MRVVGGRKCNYITFRGKVAFGGTCFWNFYMWRVNDLRRSFDVLIAFGLNFEVFPFSVPPLDKRMISLSLFS